MSYQQLIKPNMQLSTDALMLQSLSQLASTTQFSPQIMMAPRPQHVQSGKQPFLPLIYPNICNSSTMSVIYTLPLQY